MTTYVLIWFMYTGFNHSHPISMGSAEFNSLETCKAAGEVMMKWSNKYRDLELACVKK